MRTTRRSTNAITIGEGGGLEEGMTVDCEARKRAANALKAFIAGRVAGDEVESVCAADLHGDPCIRAVCDMVDFMCEDGGLSIRAIVRQERPLIARTIMFLHSSLEYQWQPMSAWLGQSRFLNCITFGIWEKRRSRRVKKWSQGRDLAVWPFGSNAEMHDCMGRPVFLTGGVRREVAVRKRLS